MTGLSGLFRHPRRRRECRPPRRGYVVVDLETTGMSWDDGDRIIEVAAVELDEQGAPRGCWTTLIDPGRPVANSQIHGITDRDLVHAPRFAEVADLLSRSCAGRVLVAHNLAFDSRFLRHELAACGLAVPLDADSGICTMILGAQYLPHVSGALEDLCYAAGITIRHRHWALWDADATGRLLHYYIQSDYAFARHWCRQIESSQAVEWPRRDGDDVRLLPRCPPTAGHPDGDWCGTCSRPDLSLPPLPDRPRRR